MRFVTKLGAAAGLMLGAAALSGCDPYGPPLNAGPGPYPEPVGYEAGAPPPGTPVSALGCPMPGVEPSCLSLRTVDGALFDVSAAQARPDPRSPFALEISGVVSPSQSYCRQGIGLEQVQVRQTSLRCSEGVVQGYAPPSY